MSTYLIGSVVMSKRLTRVNELLKREIGNAFFRLQPDFFDVSVLTVTQVNVTASLTNADVMVSIFNNEEQRVEIMRYINKHHADIQRLVYKHVKLKFSPKLYFKHDASLEQGDSVLNILSNLESNDT